MNTLSKLLLLAVIGFAFSCSEDEKEPAPTRTQLIAGQWKLTGSTVNGSDVFTSAPACFKDDKYTFFGSGEFVQAAMTKCGDEFDEIEATWSLAENDTVLIISGTSSSAGAYTVAEVSTSTLSGTRTILVGGQEAQNAVTFQRL